MASLPHVYPPRAIISLATHDCGQHVALLRFCGAFVDARFALLKVLGAPDVALLGGCSVQSLRTVCDDEGRLLLARATLRGDAVGALLLRISHALLEQLVITVRDYSELRACNWLGTIAAPAIEAARFHPGLRNLTMSFLSVEGGAEQPLAAEALGALGAALPEGLLELSLHFASACRISDGGVQALAASMPPRLAVLSLDFNRRLLGERRSSLGDSGVEALAAAIPTGLEELRLTLSCCRIGEAGVYAVASRLKMLPQLQRLSLSLQCNPLGNATLAALGASLPRGLQTLELHLRIMGAGDAGICAIARALPGCLSMLTLDCSVNGVSNESMFCLAEKLPPSLESLDLDFSSTDIDELGVRELMRLMPRSIRHLKLHFNHTELRTDFLTPPPEVPFFRDVAKGVTGCMLETLELQMRDTTYALLEDDIVRGIRHLIEHLPRTCRELTLGLEGCAEEEVGSQRVLSLFPEHVRGIVK